MQLDQAPASTGRRPAGPPGPDTAGLHLETAWARTEADVRAAQRLRWRIFAGEMGATLASPAGTPPGLDVDPFDAYCEHLLVRTRSDGDRPPRVVGTYRLLTPLGAQRAGGLYADAEFSLNRLDHLRPRMAEVGRACVDPAWRGGAAMLLLWSALAQFMHHNGLTHMIGCASVPMHDGGHAAASLWAGLRRSHLAEPALAVQPRLPLPLQALRNNLPVAPPPLLAGYLRCGARLLGPPAWDPDFGTADLPLMLRLDDLPPAYRRRFDLPA